MKKQCYGPNGAETDVMHREVSMNGQVLEGMESSVLQRDAGLERDTVELLSQRRFITMMS